MTFRAAYTALGRSHCALALILLGCTTPQPASPGTSMELSLPPSATSVSTGEITREEAIEIAGQVLQEAGHDWDVLSAEVGALDSVRPGWEEEAWGQDFSGDLRVWVLGMRQGDLTAEVVLDAVDGSLYGSVMGVGN